MEPLLHQINDDFKPFSHLENDKVLKELFDHGFTKLILPIKRLHSLKDNIQKKLMGLDVDCNVIKDGYSHKITYCLEESDITFLNEIAEYLISQKSVKNYIFKPNLIQLSILYSTYNGEAKKNPTHAHLWHRDADDDGPQLKLMIPLVDKCNADNGQLSAISKSACHWTESFQDRALLEQINSSTLNKYTKSDCVRLTDHTVRRAINPELIYDFNSNFGEALLIDTNSCYHKGGLILRENLHRILAEITIGGISSKLHADNSFAKKIYRRFIRTLLLFFGINKYKDKKFIAL